MLHETLPQPGLSCSLQVPQTGDEGQLRQCTDLCSRKRIQQMMRHILVHKVLRGAASAARGTAAVVDIRRADRWNPPVVRGVRVAVKEPATAVILSLLLLLLGSHECGACRCCGHAQRWPCRLVASRWKLLLLMLALCQIGDRGVACELGWGLGRGGGSGPCCA